MNSYIADKLKTKLQKNYCVLLETSECPVCHSLRSAMFLNLSNGYPAVIAICLKCGGERALPRFRPDEIDVKKLSDWRNAVLARDGFKCHICGRPADMYPLEAHHIIPRGHDPNKRYWYSVNNGIAVCKQCHVNIHGEWMKKYRKES